MTTRLRRYALALVLAFVAQTACAQFGVPWSRTPTVTIVANGEDTRITLVHEAIAFWNKTLEELGSGFRIGSATRVDQPIPEEALRAMSDTIVGSGGRYRAVTPESLAAVPGDLVIFLAHSEFVSYAGPFDNAGRRVVGIRGRNYPPIGLPNVTRNVVAHEIGHAIGLGHNADLTLLMCGRPAPCRPTEFRSDAPRMFPHAEAEKQQLLVLYPKDWKPR